MLEQTGGHPVVSVYFDLDPTEFATAAKSGSVQTTFTFFSADGATTTDIAATNQIKINFFIKLLLEFVGAMRSKQKFELQPD